MTEARTRVMVFVVVVRRIIGFVLLALGGVWFFQGIGVIHGSFMTDNTTWIVIGAVVALVGLFLLWRPRRSV